MGLLTDLVATAISGAIVNKVFCKQNDWYQCEYCGTKKGVNVGGNPNDGSNQCPALNYQLCHKWMYIGTEDLK